MKRILLAGVLTALTGLTALAQTPANALWKQVDERAMLATANLSGNATARRNIVPQFYRTLDLDRAAMTNLLATAPPEFSTPITESPVELSIPLPDGGFGRFSIQESPVMEPELAAKYPEIKTYVGQGIDDPTATVRLDLTPHGFHAMILSSKGDVFVDPYWRDSDVTYVTYNKRDFVSDKEFRCLLPSSEQKATNVANGVWAERPTGTSLRKYRLALACTGEYAVAVNGPTPTILGTLAAMTTSVNRVSGVYERDFAIRMILVANDDKLVYLDPNTDPYTNSNANSLLSQNQTTCDAQIGSANYDIGHVFSTAGGGLAGLGVVCKAASKAQGETGTSSPTGDPYDIDYVAHEMGHQFGGNHTFNSSVGSCGGGNRNASTAYETGSGISIMAYAGICSSGSIITDLSDHSDDYFHTASYTEIDTYTSTGSGSTCPTTQATGNTPPVIGALAAYTIPISTPFALTASATDADNDTITYAWEEYDKGTAQTTTAPSSSGTNTIFRPYLPTLNPARVFPALTYILNNANAVPDLTNGFSSGEILPTVARTMTFRVTARDNHAGGGGSDWASTTVTTNLSAGPFTVSSFNTAATIAGGSMQTVTWNEANTTAAPVSCTNVKISLSTDGGHTFPIVLASSVPNNGSASVTIPSTANVATTQGRIKVEAVGNIFFDISDANLTITSANVPPTLSITSGLTIVRGTPTAAVATVGNASGTSGPLTVSVADLPYGITITPSISGGNIMLAGMADCRVVTTLSSRTYPITLTVTDGVGSTSSATVNILVQPNPTPTLGTYANGSASQGTTTTVAPSTGPADANNNLPPAPFIVIPTTVPGGGTVSIDQGTGVVTVATTTGSTVGSFTIRVSLADSCGATILREFSVNITPVVLAITSAPPPSPLVVGTVYSHTFTYVGSPAPTFSLTGGTLPPGITLSPSGVLSGTPTNAGSGSFPNIMVTASNGVDPNAQQTFSLSVVTTDANYLAGYGLTGASAAYNADVDGDGIPNQLEYALHLNPTVANISGLPAITLKNYSGTKYLSITFTRYSVATDISYVVQGTSNLVDPNSWVTLASSVGGAATTGPGLVSESGSAPAFTVEVRDTVPYNPNGSPAPRFLRLEITSP